jgi:hypothetical protein
MKERSLFGFMVSVSLLGICLLTIPQFTIAVPAPIFRPIIRDIQNQLPRRMIMRMPASLDITGVNGRLRIYPILEPNSRNCFRSNCFRVSLTSEPDCQARACGLGYIATFRPSSDYSDIVQSLGDERYRRTSSITLREGIRGTYVYADPRGVSSGPFSVVIWNQNGQTFIVSLPLSQQEKQKIINIAISMANDPPIRSIR